MNKEVFDLKTKYNNTDVPVVSAGLDPNGNAEVDVGDASLIKQTGKKLRLTNQPGDSSSSNDVIVRQELDAALDAKSNATNIENGSGTGAVQQKRGGIAKGGNSAAFNNGIALGNSAFAEGDGIAVEKDTHAEGEWSYADGWCAHAEGSTNAHTSYKHTEGLANSNKDQTIHETGYGDFIYTVVSPKPSYQNACIDTQSGPSYTLYFVELENGGHALIDSKSTTQAQYEAFTNVYTRTVDGKNVFEVYKTGALANGVHIDKLKQYIIAYLAQLATGDTSNYNKMNELLGKSYEVTLVDTASDLSTFKTIVATIFGLNEQQQQVLSLVSSVDALASVVTILAFSLADFTALYVAITSSDQQAALNTIIRNSDLLDDNAMLSPVSFASGTANEIFSMAAAAIGSRNRIGSIANIASGVASEAVGVQNIIEGQNSIAVGDTNTIQKANSSGAFGNSNEVKPYDNSYEMITAFALGRFLKNMYSGSLVIGSYNDATWDASKPDKLFQIGNGTAENARSNAFEVLADGRAKVTKAPEENNDIVRKQELDTKVDKVSTANKIYGTDSTGAQTTYDKDSFGQVDDVQINGVSIVDNNKVANIVLDNVPTENSNNPVKSGGVYTALTEKVNSGTLSLSFFNDLY